LTEPGKITFNEDYLQAKVEMNDIYSGFVETRTLASPDVFPELESKNIKSTRKFFLKKRAYFWSQKISFFYFAPFAFVFPVITLYIYYYFKYGREHKKDYNVIYEREPPSNIPPLVLINLFEEGEDDLKLSARGFLATIFDLALRGYVEIYEIRTKKLGLFYGREQKFVLTGKGKRELEEKKELKDFEVDVLNFLFRSSTETTTENIKRHSRYWSNFIQRVFKEH
jgi:uncharacterized membrane protein